MNFFIRGGVHLVPPGDGEKTERTVADRPFVVKLNGKVLAGFLYEAPAVKFAKNFPTSEVVSNGRQPGEWRTRKVGVTGSTK